MRRRAISLLFLAFSVTRIHAQEIRLSDAGTATKNHVTLISDSLQVAAGKPDTVELRFRVDPGFHINSHAPKDELLIPTTVKFNDGDVKVLAADYQSGLPFRLNIGPGETLDVYQAEFRITLRILAPKGSSTLVGSLHYQACDNAACFPPKTLPLKIIIAGR